MMALVNVLMLVLVQMMVTMDHGVRLLDYDGGVIERVG